MQSQLVYYSSLLIIRGRWWHSTHCSTSGGRVNQFAWICYRDNRGHDVLTNNLHPVNHSCLHDLVIHTLYQLHLEMIHQLQLPTAIGQSTAYAWNVHNGPRSEPLQNSTSGGDMNSRWVFVAVQRTQNLSGVNLQKIYNNRTLKLVNRESKVMIVLHYTINTHINIILLTLIS